MVPTLNNVLRRSWFFPVAVAILLRVGFWAIGIDRDAYVSPDTAGYWRLSDDLLEAYQGTDDALLETALLRAPGYPAVLATFRSVVDSLAAAALFQSLVGAFTVLLGYRVAGQLAGPTAASIAAWWLALDPLLIVQSSVLLTETSFSLLVLGAIAILTPLAHSPPADLPKWRWAAAGLLLAAATFVRPISLYLPGLVLVSGLLVIRVRPRVQVISGILVFVAAFAAPVVVWHIHNYSLTGVFTFSTVQGINLAQYRAVGAMIHEEGVTLPEAREEMRQLVQAEASPRMNPAELAAVQTRVGIREILERPVGYAYSAIRGLGLTLFGPSRADIRDRLVGGPFQVLVLPLAGIAVASAAGLAAFSALGSWRLIERRAWVPLLLLMVPLIYLVLIGSGQESEARFRVPLAPMMAVLGGVGVTSLFSPPTES